jgi:amidohydrolase
MLHNRLIEVCRGTAAAMGCEAEVTITTGVPSVNNDADVAERIRQVASAILPEESIVTDLCTTGAEDMALLMDDIPGCYFFLGIGSEDAHPHHNPRFDIDEDALPIGAAILAGTAASYTLAKA